MSIRIIRPSDPSYRQDILRVRDALRGGGLVSADQRARQADVRQTVRQVIEDVSARGDQAIIDLTRRIEGVDLTGRPLRVEPKVIRSAHASADGQFLALVRRVADNIRQYQRHILIQAPPPLRRNGRSLGVRYTPVDRAGVYVPGGRAVYPSTVLMTVVPAQVAGVGQIAIVSPPTSEGDVSPAILAVAAELGVEEVYRVSGTAGIAALALGTASIPAVDKIVGPGNAFITEAKRQLLGQVGIDSLAGPSEVLIVADDAANSDWLAADMLAQAEHDPGSAVLVTPSAKLAQRTAAAIDAQLAGLSRRQAAAAAISDYGAIILVDSLQDACEIANEFATEHLQIITADDQAALAMIRHAGAVFLGPHTPVPVGDYLAGPSHVLPTGGTARFFSALSCNDFLKASSVLSYDASALAADAADVADFARREGLTAHGRSATIRQEK